MIKVLLIAYACEPNKGSEPGVGWNWAINLSKFVDLTVVTRKNNKLIIEKELLKRRDLNLNFIYYDLKLLSMVKNLSSITVKFYYLLWVLSLKKIIRSYIKNNKVDIIHFVTFNTFMVPPPINYFGIKSVWGPIGGGILGHEESFKKISPTIYIKEKIRNLLVKKLSKSSYIKNSLSNFDQVLFANTDTARLLVNNSPFTLELETGIDNNIIIKNKERCKSENLIKIIAIGVLEPRKGFHLLLDSLRFVKSNVMVNIIGEGPLKKRLVNFVFRYKLNVNFHGFIPYNEVFKFYRENDFLVFPSIRDTSGNVVLEAMSQGLPIIAFDHHGMHDVLTEECAIKIPVTNYEKMVKDLALAIDKLSNDENLRHKMSEASINRIKEKYLWEDKAKRMIEIYRKILNENSSNS